MKRLTVKEVKELRKRERIAIVKKERELCEKAAVDYLSGKIEVARGMRRGRI